MSTGSEQHYGGGPVPPGAFAPRPEPPRPPAKDQLADYWQRVVAAIVDGLIVGLLSVAVLAAIGAGFFGDGEAGVGQVVVSLLLLAIFWAVIALVYAPLIMSRTNGQTLGKMITGCRVVRADGARVTFGWAVLREVLVKGLLVGVASAVTGGIASIVDVIWPLVDGQNRALHDYVVDSRVVKA